MRAMRGSLIVLVILGAALTAHAFDKSDEPKMKAAAAELEKMVGAAAKTCGAKITTEIDWSTFDSSMKPSALGWLGTVTGCGVAARSLDLLCQDDLGKAAAKEVSAVRCVYQPGMEPSHKFENGKLTIGVTVYGAETLQFVMFQESWPKVHAHRLAAGITASARKELLSGLERDNVPLASEVTLDIDSDTFVVGGYAMTDIAMNDICNRDFSSFLHLVSENLKGKPIVKGLKHLRCATTQDEKGKAPAVDGDTLTYYARIVAGKSGTFRGFQDPQHSFNLFRKAKKLGGECAWLANDPETAADCKR